VRTEVWTSGVTLLNELYDDIPKPLPFRPNRVLEAYHETHAVIASSVGAGSMLAPPLWHSVRPFGFRTRRRYAQDHPASWEFCYSFAWRTENSREKSTGAQSHFAPLGAHSDRIHRVPRAVWIIYSSGHAPHLLRMPSILHRATTAGGEGSTEMY
jgi:hypothetical protein